ncbi:MAG: hypothetical protein ABIM99_02150 [Candidatus Dojkabacteria bacterium]
MLNKRSLIAIVVVGVMVLSGPLTTQALTNTSSPNVLYDDFDAPFAVPNQSLQWDYWYKTIISADSVGFLKQENLLGNIDCNNDACVTLGSEGSTNFARLALYPETYPGVVNIAQLSEQRDAFSYGVPHRWLPTVGHPVTMTTRMRFSPNYKADASGTAVGTTLIELWNAPDYYKDPNVDYTRDNSQFGTHTDNTFVMGFSWTDAQTLGGLFKGFKATVVDKIGFPYYSADLSSVNINDWFTAKTVWSTSILGVQTVSFYINNQLVGLTIPVIPMPALAVNIIQDNTQVTLGSTGFVYVRGNPTSAQLLDIDYVSITQ